jgi:sigma-E factor negative regulatory protein RseC
MIIEQGHVVRTEGEFAWVETRQQSACGSCSAKSGCGTSALESLFNRSPNNLKVANIIHARVGQHVTLGLSEGGLVKSALLVYMTPLLGLFLGAGLMKYIAPHSEFLVICAAGVGLLGGLLFARRIARRLEGNPDYQPVMLTIEH